MTLFLSLPNPKTFGIAEANCVPHILIECNAVDEMTGFFGPFERIVRTEHDALVAKRGDRTIERLRRTHPDVVTTKLSLKYCEGFLAS